MVDNGLNIGGKMLGCTFFEVLDRIPRCCQLFVVIIETYL